MTVQSSGLVRRLRQLPRGVAQVAQKRHHQVFLISG
jgi:hypothetical protein